jgi:sugar phosphate isomerase/epimerase
MKKSHQVLVGRRSFLQLLGGSLGAVVAFPTLGAPMLHRGRRPTVAERPILPRRLERIGVQLYTVRGLMKQDAEGTLRSLARIGYGEVELAGLYGLSAREMRGILDRQHLTAPSSHIGTAEMRGDWARTLADASTLGQRYITCAWIDESERTMDGYKRIAELFNRCGQAARAAGLQLCYHNHDFEFAPMGDVVPYDLLLAECDQQLVKMEMDIYWVVKGGRDPLAYIARNPARFPLVHVKDMDRRGAMTDVGRGVIDFRAIFALSGRAGISHYFVEHDDPPSPLESVKTSYDFLRRLEF